MELWERISRDFVPTNPPLSIQSLAVREPACCTWFECLLARPHVRSWVTLYEWYPSCADGSRKLGIGCVRTALWGTGDCIINTGHNLLPHESVVSCAAMCWCWMNLCWHRHYCKGVKWCQGKSLVSVRHLVNLRELSKPVWASPKLQFQALHIYI